MSCSGFNLTPEGGTRTRERKKKTIKCQQSLVLIKHPVQTDSALDAAAARELALIENEQNKIQQTPVHVV